MCFPSAPAPVQTVAPAPPAPAPLAESVSPNYNANAESGANPNGPNMLRDPSVQAPGGPGIGALTGAAGLNPM